MFGDSGAPTGQQPLYSGNDVMVGGLSGGDIMKGFSGDDIMLGHGSFTKFIGGLGWDWGSYELATQGVDEDMNRKEFVAANGAVDNIRDIWQHTEGASGSAFDDIILGDNATRLLATKDELDNVNLIRGLQAFFDPGVVSFDGGNIMLGGGGSDTLIGGGGNDIIDGDAWLHVGLTSYSAGGQIIRQILYDPNGNTYDPATAKFTLGANGWWSRAFMPGTGHVNASNVDTAIYNDVMSNYNVALFGPDAEGFLTIQQNGASTVVGGNPQGVLGGSDGTDRIRNIERLQFADGTVAIDKNGNMISSSFNPIADPNYATLYAPYYDAVPFGTPTITETDPLGNVVDPAVAVVVGNTLHASVATISDFDGVGAISYQWQYDDAVSGNWVNYAGAPARPSRHQLPAHQFARGSAGSQLCGRQGLHGTAFLRPDHRRDHPAGRLQHAAIPDVGTQFNGIGNTTAVVGSTFDFFSPFTSIFNDHQTSPDLLTYTATLTDGSPLSNANLQFNTLPGVLAPPGGVWTLTRRRVLHSCWSGSQHRPSLCARYGGTDRCAGEGNRPGRIVGHQHLHHQRDAAEQPAARDRRLLHHDRERRTDDAALDRCAAQRYRPQRRPVHRGGGGRPTNGTLTFNADGTFVYIPNHNFVGTDSFTYQDTDSAGAVSNIATATINVVNVGKITVASDGTGNDELCHGDVHGRRPYPGGRQSRARAGTPRLMALRGPRRALPRRRSCLAVTGPTGIFLRGTASFQNAGSTVSVTSDPVYYIRDNDLGDNMTGACGNNIIFGNGGDDLIAAGIGSLLAYGGLGNDTFVATVGDGVATFDGQAGANTLDMSHTSAAATVNLATGTASSAQTGAATLVSIQNVIGGSGNDTITGSALDNVITGGPATTR